MTVGSLQFGNLEFDIERQRRARFTCFEGSVKAEVTSFGFAGMARRPHHHPLHIPEATLGVRVVRVCSYTDQQVWELLGNLLETYKYLTS
jgi:hypothetical protein